jgi:hypothetical protein
MKWTAMTHGPRSGRETRLALLRPIRVRDRGIPVPRLPGPAARNRALVSCRRPRHHDRDRPRRGRGDGWRDRGERGYDQTTESRGRRVPHVQSSLSARGRTRRTEVAAPAAHRRPAAGYRPSSAARRPQGRPRPRGQWSGSRLTDPAYTRRSRHRPFGITAGEVSEVRSASAGGRSPGHLRGSACPVQGRRGRSCPVR